MPPNVMLDKITEYFGRLKDYSTALLDQLNRMIDSIPDQDRQRVVDALYEQYEAGRILSAKNLAETCRNMGVPYRKASGRSDAIEVQCAACGLSYDWAIVVTDQERIDRNIHSSCPRCGYAHGDELKYQSYARNGFPEGSKYPETHLAHMKRCRDNHTAGKEPAWSRQKAVEEIKAAQREEVERKIQAMQEAAKYSLHNA